MMLTAFPTPPAFLVFLIVATDSVTLLQPLSVAGSMEAAAVDNNEWIYAPVAGSIPAVVVRSSADLSDAVAFTPLLPLHGNPTNIVFHAPTQTLIVAAA